MLSEYEATGVFHGMVSMHQPYDDLAVTLTLWTSAEAADAVVGALREKSVALFSGLLLDAPHVTAYDVLLTALDGTGTD